MLNCDQSAVSQASQALNVENVSKTSPRTDLQPKDAEKSPKSESEGRVFSETFWKLLGILGEVAGGWQVPQCSRHCRRLPRSSQNQSHSASFPLSPPSCKDSQQNEFEPPQDVGKKGGEFKVGNQHDGFVAVLKIFLAVLDKEATVFDCCCHLGDYGGFGHDG